MSKNELQRIRFDRLGQYPFVRYFIPSLPILHQSSSQKFILNLSYYKQGSSALVSNFAPWQPILFYHSHKFFKFGSPCRNNFPIPVPLILLFPI